MLSHPYQSIGLDEILNGFEVVEHGGLFSKGLELLIVASFDRDCFLNESSLSIGAGLVVAHDVDLDLLHLLGDHPGQTFFCLRVENKLLTVKFLCD